MRQKLKAKEWDELLAKGKRFRILQPVKIGCIWAADKDGGADLKVLQQFTACLLETVPPEEEQTPKASKREKRDQQSEHQLCAGAGWETPSGGWPGNSQVLQRNSQSHCSLGRCPFYDALESCTGWLLQSACFPDGHTHS